MGFAERVFRYVTHKRAARTKQVRAGAPHLERGAKANLPEFLDEVPRADEGEREWRQHQWRPRPFGDDLPLSG